MHSDCTPTAFNQFCVIQLAKLTMKTVPVRPPTIFRNHSKLCAIQFKLDSKLPEWHPVSIRDGGRQADTSNTWIALRAKLKRKNFYFLFVGILKVSINFTFSCPAKSEAYWEPTTKYAPENNYYLCKYFVENMLHVSTWWRWALIWRKLD